MSFLKELREVALHCPDEGMKQLLRASADDVAVRLGFVGRDVSDEKMIALNGAWALAKRRLDHAKRIPPNNSSGGALHGTVLQERLAA